MSSKRNLKPKDSIPLHLPSHKQTVTFIEIDRPTSAEVIVDEEHIDPHINNKLGRTAPIVEKSSEEEEKMVEEVHMKEEEQVKAATPSTNLHPKDTLT